MSVRLDYGIMVQTRSEPPGKDIAREDTEAPITAGVGTLPLGRGCERIVIPWEEVKQYAQGPTLLTWSPDYGSRSTAEARGVARRLLAIHRETTHVGRFTSSRT